MYCAQYHQASSVRPQPPHDERVARYAEWCINCRYIWDLLLLLLLNGHCVRDYVYCVKSARCESVSQCTNRVASTFSRLVAQIKFMRVHGYTSRKIHWNEYFGVWLLFSHAFLCFSFAWPCCDDAICSSCSVDRADLYFSFRSLFVSTMPFSIRTRFFHSLRISCMQRSVFPHVCVFVCVARVSEVDANKCCGFILCSRYSYT